MREKKAKKTLHEIRKSYDLIAEEFDRTRKKKIEEFVLFRKYIKPDSFILDMGCGNGRLLKYLISVLGQEHARHYLGIDNSEQMLKKAYKNYPEGSFVSGDLLSIPIEKSTVDTVFCIRTFHHLPSFSLRLQSLLELERVLRPGGVVIITVWNLWKWRYIKNILMALLRSITSLGDYAPNDLRIRWGQKAVRYYHAFTPGELRRLVKKTDFCILDQFQISKGQKTSFINGHDLAIILQKKI